MSQAAPLLAIRPLPGSAELGKGFDIFAGKPKDTGLFNTVSADDQIQIGSLTFDIAKIVRKQDPQTPSFARSWVFSSRSEYSSHFAAEAGISIKSALGTFSGRFSAQFEHDQTFTSERWYALYEYGVHKWTLTLQAFNLDDLVPQVKKDASELPESFTDDNLYLFVRFFEKYGTHFVSSVSVGGQLTYCASVDKSYSSDSKSIKAQMQAEWKACFASGSASASTAWTQVDQNWKTSRQTYVEIIGGDTGVLASAMKPAPGDDFSNEFKSWLESIDSAPVASGYSLRFIGELFSGDRSDAVREAYIAYTSKWLQASSGWRTSSMMVAGKTISSSNEIGPNTAYNDPKIPNTLCVMHIVVFDRATLTPVLNKKYAPNRVNVTNDIAERNKQTRDMFMAAYHDVKQYEGDNKYMVAIATQGWCFEYTTANCREFHNFLVSSGADETALNGWETASTYTTGLIDSMYSYSLLGICGSQGTGIEVVGFGRRLNDRPPSASEAIVIPAHSSGSKLLYRPIRA